MDIAAMSSSLSAAQLGNQVSVAVLKKAMDVQETQGQEMVGMLQNMGGVPSTNPAIGKNVDIMA